MHHFVRKFNSKVCKSIPLFLGCSLLLTQSNSQASDQPIHVATKHIIPKAIQLEITPRGQLLFENKLNSVLGNLGISLEEGYFPSQLIKTDKDLNVDDFEQTQPEAVKVYKQVRDLLTQWLTGFSMEPHRPAIQIGESGYEANFSRFGLITDQKIMDKIGYREGAVLAIELEISELNMASNLIKAWDVNNEFLGSVQLEDINIQAKDAQSTMKIRLPFYVNLDSTGKLNFTALEVEQNISKANISLEYKKLLVPQMGVIINGKTFYINNQQLESFAQSQVPAILEKVREYIGDFAKNQLPEMLNQKAKEQFTGKIEQLQNMEAPGTEPGDNRPALNLGMTLSELKLQNSLFVSLDGYIEDPLSPQVGLIKNAGSKGAFNFSQVPKSQYDMGLVLDRAVINRSMQLGFLRKNFEKIKQSDGTFLKLVAPPIMDYVAPPKNALIKANETYFKLRVSVENQPHSLFLKETIVVSFDIIGKMRPTKNGKALEMILLAINTNSMILDDSYLSVLGRMFKSKVHDGIREELANKSKSWKTKEELLNGSLPFPPEIVGIQTSISQLNFDPQGYLVMYLTYVSPKGVGQ